MGFRATIFCLNLACMGCLYTWSRLSTHIWVSKQLKLLIINRQYSRLLLMCTYLWLAKDSTRAPSQYPIRRVIVRSRQVSKPRNLYLELTDRSEIRQSPRQQCCRGACQILKRCDDLNYQSRGFETSRDLTSRRLIHVIDIETGPRMRRTLFIKRKHQPLSVCPYVGPDHGHHGYLQMP